MIPNLVDPTRRRMRVGIDIGKDIACGGEKPPLPGAGDAEALYRKLADVVLPLYQDRARWVWMMKQSISKIGSTFNSQRMMRRYAAEAYMR